MERLNPEHPYNFLPISILDDERPTDEQSEEQEEKPYPSIDGPKKKPERIDPPINPGKPPIDLK